MGIRNPRRSSLLRCQRGPRWTGEALRLRQEGLAAVEAQLLLSFDAQVLVWHYSRLINSMQLIVSVNFFRISCQNDLQAWALGGDSTDYEAGLITTWTKLTLCHVSCVHTCIRSFPVPHAVFRSQMETAHL